VLLRFQFPMKNLPIPLNKLPWACCAGGMVSCSWGDLGAVGGVVRGGGSGAPSEKWF
jgi:hypothetical protein